MNIPDPAVYSLLPVLATGAVGIARLFIRSAAAPAPAPLASHHSIDDNGETDTPRSPVLTVRAYREIATMLKEELNGRYMMAEEARAEFSEIRREIGILAVELRLFIAEHTHHSVGSVN